MDYDSIQTPAMRAVRDALLAGARGGVQAYAQAVKRHGIIPIIPTMAGHSTHLASVARSEDASQDYAALFTYLAAESLEYAYAGAFMLRLAKLASDLRDATPRDAMTRRALPVGSTGAVLTTSVRRACERIARTLDDTSIASPMVAAALAEVLLEDAERYRAERMEWRALIGSQACYVTVLERMHRALDAAILRAISRPTRPTFQHYAPHKSNRGWHGKRRKR